jgi:hypothetical protein
MDINKMLLELRAERDQLAEAILVLERLAFGRGKRRGRPPAWMTSRKMPNWTRSDADVYSPRSRG